MTEDEIAVDGTERAALAQIAGACEALRFDPAPLVRPLSPAKVARLVDGLCQEVERHRRARSANRAALTELRRERAALVEALRGVDATAEIAAYLERTEIP